MAVKGLRRQYPRWGKENLTVLLAPQEEWDVALYVIINFSLCLVCSESIKLIDQITLAVIKYFPRVEKFFCARFSKLVIRIFDFYASV
jgi:hypothetical protein